MRNVWQILLSAVFVSAFLFVFSAAAHAQQIPDYLFLEVLDSDKKPVAEATVVTTREVSQTIKTDKEGKISIYPSTFEISKPGFYTFESLGIGRTSRQTRATIELLKIPQTAAERRIVGNEQRKREFMYAAKNGDAEALRRLLKIGINPNLTTDDLRGVSAPKGIPAVVFAANSGDGETIKVLLKAGVSLRSPPNEQVKNILNTYLWADPFRRRKPKDEAEKQEIMRLYAEGFEELIKAGADINALRYDTETPLIIAAQRGFTPIVKILLTRGVSANYKNNYGETVLMKAAEKSYDSETSKAETIRLLLERGADPNAVKDEGYNCRTPLINAAGGGDVEAMRVLVENGAKIDFVCKMGASALSSAISFGSAESVEYLLKKGAKPEFFAREREQILSIAVARSNPKIIKMLIDFGFPVDGKGYGTNALMKAIENYSSFEIVNLLLETGADPNVLIGGNKYSDDCKTPLMAAVRTGKADTVKALIAKKADAKFVCRDGQSALTAAMTGYNPLEMLKLLIENGADVKGRQGQFALDYLQTYRERIGNAAEIEKIFEAAGAKMKPALSKAVENGQAEAVRRLTEAGGDVNYADMKGETLLMKAVKKDHLEIARILLAKGANVDAKADSGMTALMFAVERSTASESFIPTTIKLLLDANADVNITAPGYNGENSRKTALMIAALNGNLELIKLLIDKKADINFDAGGGDSALGFAVRGANVLAATKLLLDAGADAKGLIGQTALKIARQMINAMNSNQQYADAAKLLESYGAK